MVELGATKRLPITWERATAILGHRQPPKKVWQKQFDYFDDELQRIARTAYDEFDFSDLWYYHHDLAYVELQPDLFAYLFPVCLMDWHQTLMKNEPCSHGDSEFHYGLHQGDVLCKMMTEEQQDMTRLFLRDSFMERLDSDRRVNKAHGWIGRFNSVGIIMPRIDLLWNQWWNLATVGQAAAAIQYCSGLMYFDGENPLFPMWTPQLGGGGPYLWANDSHIYSAGWRSENIEFLRSTLSVDFVQEKLSEATARLEGNPEHDVAEKMLSDFPAKRELIHERVQELPRLLQDAQPDGWTV